MFEVYIAMPSGCMSKAREFKATEEDKCGGLATMKWVLVEQVNRFRR